MEFVTTPLTNVFVFCAGALGFIISGPVYMIQRCRVRHSTRRTFPLPGLRRLKISVVIPAHNEGTSIKSCIRRVDDCACEREDLELIVVDASSTDSTKSVAEKVKTRIAKQVITSASGRAAALNAGAAQCSGDVLFFLHADTLVPPGFDKMIRDEMRRPEVLAGCFSFGTDSSSFEDSVPAGMGLIEWGANLRSHMFQLPYGDQGLFLLRERWRQLGPFPDLVMMEDYEFMRTLRAEALAERVEIVTLDAVAKCSGRRWAKHGVLMVTLINQLCVLAYSLGISDKTIFRYYYGKSFDIPSTDRSLSPAKKSPVAHSTPRRRGIRT